MGLYDAYKNRMNYYGSSEMGLLEKSTVQFINQNFANSPTYRSASVDGVSTDIRLIRGKDPTVKTVTFRPNASINRGAYVVVDGYTWLMQSYDPHPYFPTGNLIFCSDNMRWKLPNGTLKTYPCSFTSLKRKTDMHVDKEMEMVDFQIFMFIQYNVDTSIIHEGLRLVFGSQAFQVYGVDNVSGVYNGHGYIQCGLNISTLNANDDMVNLIADNSIYYKQQNGSVATGGKLGW